MQQMGLEPTRDFSHYPLKIARLPFRHYCLRVSKLTQLNHQLSHLSYALSQPHLIRLARPFFRQI